MKKYVIKIPFEETIVRDLIITALSKFIDIDIIDPNAKIEYNGSELIIKTETDSFFEILRDMFSTVLGNSDFKEKAGVRFPNIHKNDKQTLDKIFVKLGIRAPNGDYLSYIKSLIQWAIDNIDENRDIWVDQLSRLSIKKNNIILGDGTYTNLQPLKIEKYEYGKGFGVFDVKYDYKLSKEWMALILAGFVISYCYYSDNEIILSPLPEFIFMEAFRNSSFREYIRTLTEARSVFQGFFGEKGIYGLVSKIRLKPSPLIAYILLLGFQAYLTYYEKGFVSLPQYIIIRILYGGRSFTLLERVNIDVEPVIKFAHKLINYTDHHEDSLKQLIDFLRCTIKLSTGRAGRCKRDYGDYVTCYKIVQKLYQAIIGSHRPDELIYLIARLSPEKSPLKSFDLLKGVYNALSSYSCRDL